MEAPELPSKFPCWVKAVYSYGGETRRDLGFLEGDYIECLNAGDGSWWTGRLKRDPRMVGKFPSNFVKVLDQAFQPATRNASPMPGRHTSTPPSSGQTTPAATPKPKSVFRKPFSAHAAAGAPNPQAAARDLQSRSSTPTAKKATTKPYSAMKKPELSWPPPNAKLSRPPSPKIPQPIARGGVHRPSIKPMQEATNESLNRQSYHRYREVQPSRPPSPMIVDRYNNENQGQDFEVEEEEEEEEGEAEASPPPPPPPAHRVAYTRQQLREEEEDEDQEGDQLPGSSMHSYELQQSQRTPSPAPSHHTGLTPSPLRDAMNDVMTSLEGMGVEDGDDAINEDGEGHQNESEVWSPDAFDQVYEMAREQRPRHTMNTVQHNEDERDSRNVMTQPQQDYDQQLSSYVERMERRLDKLHRTGSLADEEYVNTPRHSKNQKTLPRPPSAHSSSRPGSSAAQSSRPDASESGGWRTHSRMGSFGRALSRRGLGEHKSSRGQSRDRLARTFTNKSSITVASSTAQSSTTNNSNGSSATSQSLMSGHSAGGFSATSAGSWARRKFGTDGNHGPQSSTDNPRPATAMSGISYHSSHATDARVELSSGEGGDQGGLLGGLASPVAKKRGLFQRIKDSARTTAASARTNMATDTSREQPQRPKSMLDGITSISGAKSRHPAQDMGLGGDGGGGGIDWVQMRRDVNRSNSLSRNERNERAERCQMLDLPVMNPADILNETAEGDESADGYPISDPTDFSNGNLALVDRSARFVTNLPTMINATSLSQTYLCRQYRSDVQRLRAIFTWVSERVAWEEDYEGKIDPRRVIVSRRGCSEEIAALVAQMCLAVGLHAEVVHGYLKTPGETFSAQDLQEAAARPNHWWNAVIVEGEWRMMDCALASPTNPHRSAYSATSNQVADSWYFLARPMEFCYTHVPLLPEQQHVLPPLTHDVLLALPVACPAFFKNGCSMWDYDTSLVHLEKLDMAHIQISVPDDTELYAEVESQSFALDADGDLFESGDTSKKRALAQAEYITLPHDPLPLKRYTIKGVLPPSSTSCPRGVLNIFAGKRGLMQGIHKNPHSLALALPLVYDGGDNPPYDFFLRHPTPHALRHELYVVGPLCRNLVMNNTFVFSVRQHPSGQTNPHRPTGDSGSGVPSRPGSAMSIGRPSSALSIGRPSSALSMASISASGSAYSNPSNASGASHGSASSKDGKEKPAKLAIQSPSGKILRMTQKINPVGREEESGVCKAGTAWETIIKIGERGTWRGLVLADRSARWCVWGEWEAL
ncbi:MAG: hypothetical protein Q9159_000198 [Coniocarpon cinnabarinum]